MRKSLLAGKKAYPTIGKEFNAYYDFFYHIPKTTYTLTNAKKICRGKRATLFEIDTLRRYQALSEMKDSQKAPLGNRAFWLNVQNSLDDKVEYISNEQLISVVPGLPRTNWEIKKHIKKKGHFLRIRFLISTYPKESFLKISKYLVEGFKKY